MGFMDGAMMGMGGGPFGALLGGGLGALGGLFGSQGNNHLGDIWNIYAGNIDRTKQAYNQDIMYGKQALGAIRQGYGQGLAELNRVGGAERSRLLTSQQQGLGAAKQQAISRGVYGTGAFDAAQANIMGQTEHSLAALESQLAGQRSNLLVSSGLAQAGGLNNIGGLYAQEAGAVNQQTSQWANILNGAPQQAGDFSNALSGLFSGMQGGYAMGNLFGGFGGGGGGMGAGLPSWVYDTGSYWGSGAGS